MQFSITPEVDAPPEVVFAVLSEVERWPEWTPTVTALEPGRGFRIFSRSPGAPVEANHWAEPTGAGHRSRVTLSVTFDGFLGRVIGWMMRGLNERYLAQEAAGLKRRSEERARGTE